MEKIKSNRLEERQIETEFARRFIVKHIRKRYLALLEARKIGEGFGELAHFTQNLDLKYCDKIPNATKKGDIDFVIDEIAKNTDSRKCYIVSESKLLDGKWMTLEDAATEVVGSNIGTLLLLENGKIFYHESEEIKERYIGIRL